MDECIRQASGPERNEYTGYRAALHAAFPLRKYFKESLTPGVYD